MMLTSHGRSLAGLAAIATAVSTGSASSVYTFEVIADRNYTRNTIKAINEWDPNSELVELSADIVNGERGVVSVVMATAADPIPAWRLAQLLRANIDLYRFSYYPRTIRTWNLLPSEIVAAQTIASFTAALTKAINDGRIVIIYPKASQYISAGIATGPTVAKPLHLY